MTSRSTADLRDVSGRQPPDRGGTAGWRRRSAGSPAEAAGRAGFEPFYAEEWSGLVALGWSLTGSWAAAEELVQDAFTDAYRRWDEIALLDRPGAWVRRAVLNRSASYHRDRASEQRGLTRLTSRSGVDADRSGTDRTGDHATERVGDPGFWAAVRALPQRQAACVALHYLDDLPVAAIAEVFGCRPATVRVHLHRGRSALASRLADPAGAPPAASGRPTTFDAQEEQR